MNTPDPLLARLDAMLDHHGIMGHARRQMDSELRALLADERRQAKRDERERCIKWLQGMLDDLDQNMPSTHPDRGRVKDSMATLSGAIIDLSRLPDDDGAPPCQDDMAGLIDEVRRLRALAESQAMDLMVAKTKIMALMGAMDIKPSQMTDKRRRENR